MTLTNSYWGDAAVYKVLFKDSPYDKPFVAFMDAASRTALRELSWSISMTTLRFYDVPLDMPLRDHAPLPIRVDFYPSGTYSVYRQHPNSSEPIVVTLVTTDPDAAVLELLTRLGTVSG